MALPIAEQLIVALAARLAAMATSPAPAAADLTRAASVPADNAPAANLLVEGEDPVDETIGFGIERHVMRVLVELYATGADDAAADTATQVLKADAVKALLADRTLGGLAVDLRLSEQLFTVDRGEGDAANGSAGVRLEVEYWTKTGDPYALAYA